MDCLTVHIHAGPRDYALNHGAAVAMQQAVAAGAGDVNSMLLHAAWSGIAEVVPVLLAVPGINVNTAAAQSGVTPW